LIILNEIKEINKKISARCSGKLRERHITMKEVAKALNMSESTIYKKMSGQSDLSVGELFLIAMNLRLTHEEVNYIFYG
jgi:Helix-turn-helix.